MNFIRYYRKWSFVIPLLLLFVGIYSCFPEQTPFEPETPVEEEPTVGVNFSIVGSTDSIIRVRVSWSVGGDQFGAPDYYNFTLRSSKVITDSTTGPLPDKKKVYGLADTVTLKRSLIGDSAMIVARVWSVRRELESTIPAQGQVYVKRLIPGQTKNPIIDSNIVRLIYGGPGVIYTTGPVGGSGIGPWVDTIRFNRLYVGKYPGYEDPEHVTRYGDTIGVAGVYRHPNIKFSFSKQNILQHAVDSNTSVFRILVAGQTLWIRATYSTGVFDSLGRERIFRDSLSVYTTNASGCTPWPGCYYDPWWEKVKIELPRTTIVIPEYVPLTCPSMVINYKPNNVVDTSCVSRDGYCDCPVSP